MQNIPLSAQWSGKSLTFLSQPWENEAGQAKVFPNQAAEDKAHGQGGLWEGVPG